jgi:putative ATP-dependent endonuclease of OLD family
MRIAKVTLQGFRSFKERIEVSLGSFTTIVGKNDTGKSSILYALDAFFNLSGVHPVSK